MLIIPDGVLKTQLQAIATTMFLGGGTKMHLYGNDFTPTRNTILADFTEVTNVEVPGYLAVAVSNLSAPVRTSDGDWQINVIPTIVFAATSNPPSPKTAYGWFITDTAGAVLTDSGRFATPFTFVLSGDGIQMEAIARLNQTDGVTMATTFDVQYE